MRARLSVFLSLLFLGFTMVNAQSVHIASAADMLAFAQRVNAGESQLCGVLEQDIVAPEGMRVTGDYAGQFDGRGHRVTVNLTGAGDLALFRCVTREGKVSNLAVDGAIQCSDKFAAGIVSSLYGSLENCISTVRITSSVTGDGTHGGLVAVSREGSTLVNCLYGGTIAGRSTTCCGGLIGWTEGTTYLINCAQIGIMEVGTADCATLARNNGNLIISDCYYKTLVNNTVKAGATRVTSTNISLGTLCKTLNKNAGEAIFSQRSGTDKMPLLSTSLTTGQAPVQADVTISTPQQLADFAARVNAGETRLSAVLTADLDMTGVSIAPIGQGDMPYAGLFDGQNHTISHLDIDRAGEEFVGLFGLVGVAQVRNLTLDSSCRIAGRAFVGLIGGARQTGLVRMRCLGVQGTIEARQQNAGGIIGCNYGSQTCMEMEHCYVSGNVQGANESAALSGWLGRYARVRHCYSIAQVYGVDGTNTLYRCENTFAVTNCHEGSATGRQVGIAKVTRRDIQSGCLCITLNDGGTRQVWYQTLGQDRYPVLQPQHGQVTEPDEELAFPQDPRIHCLVINEVQVANVDQYVDPSFNYGGWIELYNPTDASIDLADLFVTDDASDPMRFCLPENYGSVAAHGWTNIWFDHNNEDGEYGPNAYRQVPFKLRPEGGTISLYDNRRTLIASVTYPPCVPRCSYARSADAGIEWGMTATPTPQGSNAGITLATERLQAPLVSEESRLYTGTLDIHVQIPAGATLRYTTDGSTPTMQHGQTSTSGRFSLSESSRVYRFALYRQGYLPSPVVTRSYIHQDRTYNLPVLSISTAEANLYDDIIGVYVDGTNGVPGRGHGASNVNMDWERPVNVEYILPDGTVGVNQEAWFHVCGGWNRHLYPQRSFKLKANKELEGLNSFDYPFFAEKPHNKYKSLLVRNGGNDTGTGRVQDGIIQRVLQSSGFYLDGQAWQPVHVLFNGKYFATMNLRESSNKFFGASNYGLDTDEMDVLELLDGLSVLTGDREAFDRLVALSYQATDSAAYAQIRTLLDVDETANYMAAQCYLGSWDWVTHNNNTKLFRSKNDGRFHFVMYDVESAVDLSYRDMWNGLGRNENAIEVLLNNLCRNPHFMRLYLDAYCLVDGSIFTPERTQAVVDEALALMVPALAGEGIDPSASARRVMAMLDHRQDKFQAMRSYFGLGESMSLSLSANIPQARLMLNHSPVPTSRFDGQVFAPVDIVALAPEGYRFIGWQSATGQMVEEAQLHLDNSQSGGEYVAIFEEKRSSLVPPIRINEVSAANGIYVNEYFDREDWLELYNTTDEDIDVAGMYLSDSPTKPTRYQLAAADGISTVVPAHGTLLVWADKQPAKQQLHAPFRLSNADGSMVSLMSTDGAWKEVLCYNHHEFDETYGRYPDGGTQVLSMSIPTIGRSNTLGTYDIDALDISMQAPERSQVTLALARGWNWFSHNMAQPVEPVRLQDRATILRSQTRELLLDFESGWVGRLAEIEPAVGYKIYSTADHELTLMGEAYDPNLPVTVSQGWNWMGVPLSCETVLAAALQHYQASEGDRIVGQTGFAIYAGGQWQGNLTTLAPGQAYMLYAGCSQSFSWNALTCSARSRRHYATARQLEYSPWPLDIHRYPDVMNVVAVLQVDGVAVDASRCTVGAFCGDECRGVGVVQDSLIYMTIYGDETASLDFRLLDEDGQVYHCAQHTQFAALGLLGTQASPYVLTLDTPSVVSNTILGSRVISTQYFTLSGQRVMRPTSGFFLQRSLFDNGTTVVRKVMMP